MPRASPDHHLFQLLEIPLHVAPQLVEVKDRIPHDLPGAVERHVAAAVGLEDLDPELRQTLAVDENVLGARYFPERHDRLVLEEEQRVGDFAGDASRDEVSLELQCVAIPHPAQEPHVAGRHGAVPDARRTSQ